MLLVAAFVFSYYTVWALFTVSCLMGLLQVEASQELHWGWLLGEDLEKAQGMSERGARPLGRGD